FAGFVISSGLINLGAFDGIVIRTKLDGDIQESWSAIDLIGLESSLFSGPYTLGFVTTQDFDEVEIVIFDAIGVDLVNVHYAVLEAFCEGPWDQEPCNTPIAVSKPAYPLTIDYELTGATGINLGIVDDPEAVISESTTDYATLSNIVSAIGSLSIAVEDQITDYPAGTFVGFD